MPHTMQVLERGWLSANNIIFHDAGYTTVVDTGYCSHAPQTLALIDAALEGKPLHRIINTHLHSDHCGGNAALAAKYGCEVLIPPGEAAAVAVWDEAQLSYKATGQLCPRFSYTGIVQPNAMLQLGGHAWQALAAPGHDPSSLVLYCANNQTLISADALWENGFGVVFPELTGEPGFDEVAATLEMIGRLNVRYVIPGHGAPFTDVSAALKRADSRLNGFVQAPDKHRWHGVKVLVVYWLMDVRRVSHDAAITHLSGASYLQLIAAKLGLSTHDLLAQALAELVHKGQLQRLGDDYISH